MGDTPPKEMESGRTFRLDLSRVAGSLYQAAAAKKYCTTSGMPSSLMQSTVVRTLLASCLVPPLSRAPEVVEELMRLAISRLNSWLA